MSSGFRLATTYGERPVSVNRLSVSESGHPILAEVALICTVYNEGESIGPFMESIYKMSYLPREIVIVDGGSTDGTPDIIQEYGKLRSNEVSFRLVVEPTCNKRFTSAPIARGRNIAIQNSMQEVIACTDAGCVLDKNWLKNITEPLLTDPQVDVVAGWYLPDARSFMEKRIAYVILVDPKNVQPDRRLPSSRSVAFRKTAWEGVGGYPELSYCGEDTAFALKLRDSGHRFAYRPDAIVYWRMRSSIRSFVKMVFCYGQGDGLSALLPSNAVRNAVKLVVIAGLFILGFAVHPVYFVGAAGSLWFLLARRRWRDSLSFKNMFAFPVDAFLKIASDGTYLVGYLTGRFSRWTRSAKRV